MILRAQNGLLMSHPAPLGPSFVAHLSVSRFPTFFWPLVPDDPEYSILFLAIHGIAGDIATETAVRG